MPIFEAMDFLQGGHGAYAAIRVWENETMIAMRMTEEEYASLPYQERARKVCAYKLSNWMRVLEEDRHAKEMKASQNANR